MPRRKKKYPRKKRQNPKLVVIEANPVEANPVEPNPVEPSLVEANPVEPSLVGPNPAGVQRPAALSLKRPFANP